MVKIAIIGDIHLPYEKSATQYKALDFAVESIQRSGADAVVCIGDTTASGDLCSAEIFLKKMKEITLPKLFILGNSDLRNEETKKEIEFLKTENVLEIGGLRLIGLNDADMNLDDADKALLMATDKNTVVFSHHPPSCMNGESGEYMNKWLEENEYLAYVYAHMHIFEQTGKIYSVQALDPDKAIGEPPCVTYLTFGDKIEVEFEHFPCDKPENVGEYLGLSCFNPVLDIPFATDNGLKNIELRPSAVDVDLEMLAEKIAYWRENGGKYLSLHMPDLGYKNGFLGKEQWEKAVKLACCIGVNGVTVHVPQISVKDMKSHIGDEFLDFMADMIGQLPEKTVVGIENMHMTAKEKPDEMRRYGYTPEECLEVVKNLNERFGYERVGNLLDIGHARNNPPYSQKYNLSSWYSMLGKQTVGYHAHQVIITPDGMENHTAITEPFGRLISYCSFANCWNDGVINRKPVILEIRGGIEKYLPSIKTFLETNWCK